MSPGAPIKTRSLICKLIDRSAISFLVTWIYSGSGKHGCQTLIALEAGRPGTVCCVTLRRVHALAPLLETKGLKYSLISYFKKNLFIFFCLSSQRRFNEELLASIPIHRMLRSNCIRHNPALSTVSSRG